MITSENLSSRFNCPASSLYTLLDCHVFELLDIIEERNSPVDDKLITSINVNLRL